MIRAIFATIINKLNIELMILVFANKLYLKYHLI